VHEAPLAAGSADGGRLLCVAAVTPDKGHDLLVDALAGLTDRPWLCTCIGALDMAPAFVRELRRRAVSAGIADRVVFAGPKTRAQVDAALAASDVLLLASRRETYGMVVTEALACGLPVIAAAVGGVPEALGLAVDGERPGLLVAGDDAKALGRGIGDWLRDGDLRIRLRTAATERRRLLPTWQATSVRVADVLAGVLAGVTIGASQPTRAGRTPS
jgi:glycosyltransferase involved in cell wall biosynthesis